MSNYSGYCGPSRGLLCIVQFRGLIVCSTIHKLYLPSNNHTSVLLLPGCVVAAVSLCYAILLGLSLDGYSYSYSYDCYKAGLLAAYWAGALRWVIAAAALHNTRTGVTALVSASSLFTVAM